MKSVLIILAFSALLLEGCAIAPRRSVPKEAANTALVPGFSETRIMLDPDNTNSLYALKRFMKGLDTSGGADGHLRVLALSGGGVNGAFGAGLLCGWTQAGTRPQFDVVTGVSTGSLIAPLAFLGSEFDPQLQHGYTETGPEHVFQKRGFFGILKHRDSVADSKPLMKLIASIIGEKELAAIAREHRKGRRLLVMTTNLDSQSPVIWDLGAIAASGQTGSLQLVQKILLASSSIPVAFPPVLFEVQAQGRRYDEMHVDGGVMAQVFGGALLQAAATGISTRKPIDFYLIRNGRLGAEYAMTPRKISAIASRSIGTLMKAQCQSDVLRAWMFAQSGGGGFHYIAMPDEFHSEPKKPFDPAYMKALFEVGCQQGHAGIPWRQTPGIAGMQGVDWSPPAQAP